MEVKKIERNNLYLGDSYELIKLVPDKSIDMVYTDVPYLYKFGDGGKSELSQRIVKIKKEFSDADILNGFDYKILDEFVRVLKKVNIIIWCSKLQILDIMNYFMTLPNKKITFEPLVWVKTNPTPLTKNTWLPDIEYAIHFREQGVKLNDGYKLKSKWYKSPINQKDKVLYDHPTIKPYDMVKKHLLHTTQEGDVVLDTFLGSGTTARVCKDINRQFIGFEINKEYYEIAKERLKGRTKDDRKLGIKRLSLFDIEGERKTMKRFLDYKAIFIDEYVISLNKGEEEITVNKENLDLVCKNIDKTKEFKVVLDIKKSVIFHISYTNIKGKQESFYTKIEYKGV